MALVQRARGRREPAPKRAATLSALVIAAVLLTPAAAQADPCAAPVTNEIACENSKPGNPDWRILGAGDPTIQGYATTMSVDRGDTITFKVKSEVPYHINIFRLGYYASAGGRLVAETIAPSAPQPQDQPPCETFSSTGLIDCGNWAESALWAVPGNAVSGVYVAQLTRNDDTTRVSNITFVVRDDESRSDIVLATSDADWQAYNNYGGNNLYSCTVACPPVTGPARAYKVSYNRPFLTAEVSSGRPWLMRAEYAMISFLEASGYDLSYVSSVDLHRRGDLLRQHKLYISSGQDEYWSQTMRSSVESARDAGVNLAFFSGNELFWKTRWEQSAAGAPAADRTLVGYKDTHADGPIDPVEWTGTWQDPRFRPAAPQNALTGQLFSVNTGPGESSTATMQVPAEYGKLRMWRNTAAASLAPDSTLSLAPKTIGFEWDEDVDNGFRPAGQVRLSSTTVPNAEIFVDYGSTWGVGPATHNLTMHRAASGALVFGAGTVQWSWGLSRQTPEGNPEDLNMQQATVNLLADMSAQPYALLPGLVAAAKSSDTTAPKSFITSAPETVADGSSVLLMGTASDGGGGVVGGVEVSTDGGATWHPARGTTTWSYNWIARGDPSRIRVRATDDSLNTETPGPGVPVRVTCPCSIWGANAAPAVEDFGDDFPYELGVKFKTDQPGTVSGVRFYKSAANTGTHTGSLWSAGGEHLAQATFSGESAGGWQTVSFDSPVPVSAGATYVASYHTTVGHYSVTRDYFWPAPSPGPRGGAIDAPPLRAERQFGSITNGVFAPGATSAFPTQSTARATNYWVDVLFSPATPGQVRNATAVASGPDSAQVSWDVPEGGGAPTSYEITPYVGAAPQARTVITGTPPSSSADISGLSPSTYTFRVRAINAGGEGPLSAPSNTLTLPATQQPPPPPPPPPPPGGASSSGAGSSSVAQPPAAPDDLVPAVGEPNRALAALMSVRVARRSDGRRTLQIRARLRETVDLGVRVSRGVRTVISRPRVRLFRGDRTVTIVLPRSTAAGKADATLTFRDSAGASRTLRRTVNVPSLRSSKR